MKIKLDENLSRRLKPILHGFSHQVSTAADEGLLGKGDTFVASVCKKEGKMLLTLDLEFGDLRKYPPGTHPGIILFRLKSNSLLSVSQFVEKFIEGTDLKNFVGCNVVVDETKVRVRRPVVSEIEKRYPEAHEAPAVYKTGKPRNKKRKRK